MLQLHDHEWISYVAWMILLMNLHLTGLRLSKSHAALALEFEIYYLFICILQLSKFHILVHNIFVIFIIFLFDNLSIYLASCIFAIKKGIHVILPAT